MIDKEKYIRFQYITNFLNSEDDDDRNFIVRVLGFLENKKLDDEEHLKRIEAEMEEMWETSEICGDRLSAYMRTVAKIVELGRDRRRFEGGGVDDCSHHRCSRPVAGRRTRLGGHSKR